MKEGHLFELTLFRQDGTPVLSDTGQPVGPIPVRVDFDAAREWARFQALRARDIGYQQVTVGGPEPIWDSAHGAPYVRAFSIGVTSNSHSMAVEFPNTYFWAAARVVSSGFVQKGWLEAGEVIRYLVTSHPVKPPSDQGVGARDRIRVRERAPTPEQRRDRSLDGFMGTARPCGDPADGDLPVFVAQAVLDEIARQTEEAGVLEAGAFLLGHLHRCPDSGQVFLNITDQIPAEHTRQELMKLSFTAETFDAARSGAKARGRGEMLAGWAHSHSWLQQQACKDCKKPKASCKADFFSEEDVHVHRTAFLKAFSVALVASRSPCSELTWAMFGWKLGMVQRRGFYVTPNNHTNKTGEER